MAAVIIYTHHVMKHNITTTHTLELVVRELLVGLTPPLEGATIVGLVGDLGTGKTTFTQLLAKELGVSELVTSPTFLIMRSYKTTHPRFETLVHMDAYRIENVSELPPLGFSELLTDPTKLIVVEWADRIRNSLPPSTQYLTFTLNADGRRTLDQW